MGRILMESRHGLVVNDCVDQATTHADRGSRIAL